MQQLKSKIRQLLTHKSSCINQDHPLVLEAYRLQSQNNSVYRDFLNSLPEIHRRLPVFLPISAFKHHQIRTGEANTYRVFKSSSTTGFQRSHHYVADSRWYLDIAQSIFEENFGLLSGWRILALLPSYHEQKDSSLLYMIDHFIRETKDPDSGYYHGRQEALISLLRRGNHSRKTLLWGVSYALLDLIDDLSGIKLSPSFAVMETGGMKGRRKEIPKAAFHEILREKLGVQKIYSEYGMTELLSQAYLLKEGKFYPGRTMKVLVSEINDPLTVRNAGRGVLNIIDLANIDSCCFIQTEDVGEVYPDGSFTVNGRLDHSQLRGCNLLYAEL